jgi:hypothetical protein
MALERMEIPAARLERLTCGLWQEGTRRQSIALVMDAGTSDSAIRAFVPTDPMDSTGGDLGAAASVAQVGREVVVREIIHAFRHLDRTGCQREMRPYDLPTGAVRECHGRWRVDDLQRRMQDTPFNACGRNSKDTSRRRAPVSIGEHGGTSGDDAYRNAAKILTGRKQSPALDSLGFFDGRGRHPCGDRRCLGVAAA